MQKSGAKAYLVNTGWNGTGKRISIKDTRGIIDAILDGSILKAETKTIPYFNFEVPHRSARRGLRHPGSSGYLCRRRRVGHQGQGPGLPLCQELRQVHHQRRRQGSGGCWPQGGLILPPTSKIKTRLRIPGGEFFMSPCALSLSLAGQQG